MWLNHKIVGDHDSFLLMNQCNLSELQWLAYKTEPNSLGKYKERSWGFLEV